MRVFPNGASLFSKGDASSIEEDVWSSFGIAQQEERLLVEVGMRKTFLPKKIIPDRASPTIY